MESGRAAGNCGYCEGSGRCPACSWWRELGLPAGFVRSGSRTVACRVCAGAGACLHCSSGSAWAGGELQEAPADGSDRAPPGADPAVADPCPRHNVAPSRAADSLSWIVRETRTQKRRRESERRQSVRLPARLAVEVRFDSWAVLRLAHSLDISRHGMLFQLDRAPPVGGEVDLAARLPNGQVVRLPARVRHVERVELTSAADRDKAAHRAGQEVRRVRYAVGVEFCGINDDQQAILDASLAELERELVKARARRDE